ncbi:MAG: hypothetical protein J6N43_00310 [Prevotella sp.]|nr:hypothetical protein [Prevotella sp.]
MVSGETLNEFENDFREVGIVKKEEQENVISFFYQLGKIIYNINVSNYGKERS